jgi:restriction endonuclease S subunit
MDTTKTPRHKEDMGRRPASSVSSCLGGSKPLPPGWRWVKLGEVCEFVRGVSFDKADVTNVAEKDHVPILRAGNINLRLNTETDLIWIPKQRVSAEQFLRAADIVICMSSGSADVVGKTAFVERDWHGSVGAFCGIVRPADMVVPDFVAYWFQSRLFLDWRDNQARGANIQNLRFSQLSKLPIPLPPLSEQRRIAGILREQMAAVERARAAARARLEAVKALPAAFLRQVFPQPAQPLPPGWRWVKLGEVCELVNGDAYKENDWDTHGLPIIRIQNLNNPQAPFNYWSGPTEDRVCVANGDLLLAWSGTPGTSFGAHIWQGGPAVLNQHIFLVRTSSVVDRPFARWAINEALEELIQAAHGAVGLAHVTKREVQSLIIPLPPLSEQRRIAGILREQMAAVERARATAEAELEAIEALPAALLRRAFSGEL